MWNPIAIHRKSLSTYRKLFGFTLQTKRRRRRKKTHYCFFVDNTTVNNELLSMNCLLLLSSFACHFIFENVYRHSCISNECHSNNETYAHTHTPQNEWTRKKNKNFICAKEKNKQNSSKIDSVRLEILTIQQQQYESNDNIHTHTHFYRIVWHLWMWKMANNGLK